MARGEDEDISNVFAIPDFWKSSTWLETPPDCNREGNVFALDVNRAPSQYMLGVVDDSPNDDYFKIPPLLDLQPIPDVKLHPEPAVGDEPLVSFEVPETGIDDLWLFRGEEVRKQAEIKTWAAFDRGDEAEPTATFLTEASSAAFDALLAAKDNSFRIQYNDQYDVVDSGPYAACLLALALGRSSLLYAWDDANAVFIPTLQLLKLKGYSGQTLEGLSSACNDCGESTRYLRSFVEKIYAAHASPARTALANAIDKLLLTIQSELGLRAGRIRSILQLQALIQPVRSILVYFRGLIKRLAKSRSDEQLISMIFEEAHSVEYKEDFLLNAVCEVLRMVSRPWTDFVEEWIGLKPEEGLVMTKNGPGRSFVKVENKMWVDDQGFELEEPDYFLDEESMPSFVPDDIAREMFETGRNLRFLRTNHPDHPLARPDFIVASNPPKLEWQFDWDAMSRIEKKAKEYEETLARFLEQGVGRTTNADPASKAAFDGSDHPFQFYGQDESQINANLLASIEIFNNPIPQTTIPDTNPLHRILSTQLFSPSPTSCAKSDFNPHGTLLPLLSFGPIISAQAKIINTACLRLLFTSHSLRAHLNLQHQYHLLGNGLFLSRLSAALFDADLDTAERQSGVALTGGVMGLRLNGRDTWPPASSELRLALMGVLAESYVPPPGTPPRVSGKGVEKLMDDMDISFAVRDLSPEEIEKCVATNGLEALDFLRLSYKPPSALATVFSPVVLVKYDAVFRLLLRVLRMLYVVNQLFRDVVLFGEESEGVEVKVRFRVEAHHFVTRLAAYFFETGVGGPWGRFETWLDAVEGQIGEERKGGTSYDGPDRLRERHELALDEIMAGLLLRRRQRPVMGLVEDVFGCILGFAKALRQKKDGGYEREVRKLYGTFRKKVEVFITVCRGMSEKGSGAAAGGAEGRKERPGEENGIVRLLLMLDMSGHFAKKAAD
ncbi:Spc98 family-domain-containing protein [Coniochaeta sp. 2T2.1]|nr:Spc98 family-domain-containing protein [Coniochaeta sp. 2T2.1]